MSNKDKMREEFEKDYKDTPQLLASYTFDNGDFQYHNEFVHSHWVGFKIGWEACAAIKDAEIAELKTQLAGRTCFVPPEFQQQLDDAQNEIAALNLTIKGLREDLLAIAQSAYMPPALVGIIKQRLAKSEHHNSRALEKKLLEAKIDALEEVNGLESWVIDREIADYKKELAKLNKE